MYSRRSPIVAALYVRCGTRGHPCTGALPNFAAVEMECSVRGLCDECETELMEEDVHWSRELHHGYYVTTIENSSMCVHTYVVAIV